jgi:FG-GAP-like repeat
MTVRLASRTASLLVGLALMLVFSASALGATGFSFPHEYSSWNAYDGVTVADLDVDGIDDMVSVGGGGGVVVVWIGDGNGGFTRNEFPAGTDFPERVAVGDINGDDAPDVVVSDDALQAPAIAVLPGDGTGQFGPADKIDIDGMPAGIAIGDFAGDEGLDLAVADREDAEVLLFVQGADGSLNVAPSLPVDIGPYALAAADMDEDGRDDLVTGGFSPSGGISVLLQEEGGFAAAVPYANGAMQIGDIDLADVDGDDHLDIVVATGSDVRVLIATTPGVYSEPAVLGDEGAAMTEVADLDGDGDQDIVLIGRTSLAVTVLIQGVTGTFEAVLAGEVVAEIELGDGALGDFDQDGHADLAVSEPFSSSIAVLFGDVLHVEPAYVDFGDHLLGLGATETVTVRNSGSAPIQPGAASIVGFSTAPFSLVSDGCAGRTLAVREVCDVAVRFTSPGDATQYEADLTFPGSAGSGPRHVPLLGVAVGPHRSFDLKPTPALVDFGLITRGTLSPTREIVFRNDGDDTLELGTAAATGEFAVVGGDCPGRTLAPEATCTLGVAFKPTAATSLRAAGTLRLEIDSPWTYATASLRGRVTSPPRSRRVLIPSRPPLPPTTRVKLARLARSVPSLVRGGPKRSRRLPSFAATVKGRLALRIDARIGKRRVRLTRAAASVTAGVGHRLRFKLSSVGRRLLRRDVATRIRVVLSFRTAGAGDTVTQVRRPLILPARR